MEEGVQMKYVKSLLQLCAVFFMLLILVACPDITDSRASSEDMELTDEPMVYTEGFDPERSYDLTFGVFGDERCAAYSVVLESDHFNSRYPNINITLKNDDFGGHHHRLVSKIEEGERAYDIEVFHVNFIAQFAADNTALVDLNAFPFNAASVIHDLVDFGVAQGLTGDGRQIAIPVDIAPGVLYYRKDLAAEAGADFKNLDSWEDYIEEAKKVTGDGRWVIPNAFDVADIPLAGAIGGWIDADGGILEPKDKFMEALELMTAVRQAGIDAELNAWSLPWINAFSDGTVVTMPHGSWWARELRDWIAPAVDDWCVTYLPGKAMATFGGSFLAIPASVPADLQIAAWEVIKYLTGTIEVQLAIFEANEAFPALKTSFDDPVMNEPDHQIFIDVALNIPVQVYTEYDHMISSIWYSIVGLVLEGELTPEAGYDEALSQINLQIAQ
ncbi:ABC transporter substrate-binding protein [Spirochaeta dissipatitropha]